MDIEDHVQLVVYLRGRGAIVADETPICRTLTGGVSNRTVQVTRGSGESWVLKQALAKLRTQADWFSDPARVHREAMGIRWLGQLAPPGTIPPLVFEDHGHHLLAMQAVPQPHENWKSMLLSGRVKASHVEQFGSLLGAIHRRAAESDQPLAEIFADRSFFESLRLEPYYAYTASRVPEAAEFLNELIADTRSRRVTLVHGDYSPKNILCHDDHLILLDHEVIHWGDPAFDIGFALTHLLSKACHVRSIALNDAARKYIEAYAAAIGHVYWSDKLQAMAVRHTIGCLLARVAGRSPLEYLDDKERAEQRATALWLIRKPPPSVEDLISRFLIGMTFSEYRY
jgi:aminoglycoside phosphotransferase (APT) family kinase protein